MTYTRDRSAESRPVTDRATATFAPEQVGRTRYLTTEGYLVCEGVRMARTGPMMYSHAEMRGSVAPPPDGAMISIQRDADVLFDPDVMLSFAGKSVTNDHPPKMLTPATVQAYEVGTILNPRRGEGLDADFFIADLLIKNPKAIADVQAGKVEMSLGYHSEIEQIAPGAGRFVAMVGNHGALVKRGRAGPDCKIQDKKELPMARTIFDRLRTAFQANDEAAFDEELAKVKGEVTAGGDVVHRVVVEAAPAKAAVVDADAAPTMDAAVEARFKGIEDSVKAIGDAVAKLVPTADSEAEAKAAADAAAAEAAEKEKNDDPDCDKKSAMDAAVKAEILAPGIALPAMDAAIKTSVVIALQRKALTAAYADSVRKAHVEAVMDGAAADFEKMPAAQVVVVFNAAFALTRSANNKTVNDRKFDVPQGPMTAARLQERIVERRKAGL